VNKARGLGLKGQECKALGMNQGAPVIVMTSLPRPSATKELFHRAPPDFAASLAVLALESYAMFNVFNVLMWALTTEMGFSDRESGWIFAGVGLSCAVFTMALGPLVDSWRVRRTLLVTLVLNGLASTILGLCGSRWPWVAVTALLWPMSVALGLGTPVIQIAIRRYTTEHTQVIAFAVQYIVMNVASALSQLTVDMVRLHVLGPLLAGRWSLFLGCQVLLHAVAWAITHRWIRDICIVPVHLEEEYDLGDMGSAAGGLATSGASPASAAEGEAVIVQPLATESGKWPTAPYVPPPSSGAQGCLGMAQGGPGTVLWDGNFWRLALLSLSVVGAKSVFVFLYTIYPLYMQRAPFPGMDPSDQNAVPFMTFLMLDPIIVVSCAWLVGAQATKRHWDPFWVIFTGTCVAAAAPFFMAITHYAAVIVFIALAALGEAIWSPLFLKYSCSFTPHGREAAYFGLVGIVLFLGKLLGGLSGELMQLYCPAPGQCSQGWTVWLIVGAVAASTPLLMLSTCRWTWLRPRGQLVALRSEGGKSVDVELSLSGSEDGEQ
jgi:MFS family permease